MMKKLVTASLLLLFFSGQSQAQTKNGRLTRAESFFGLHFDLHANERQTTLGAGLNDPLIDSMLSLVRPDFIQVDCKGHPGISSYPTDVGFRANGYVGDPLRFWRDATARHDVALYVHFSGIYDRKVVAEFPQWAVTHPDGTKSKLICSVYSPYDDTYLIPQLREIAGKYNVDGAWIDGECWAYEPDYGKQAHKEFTSHTGIEKLPVKPGDKGYEEFMAFQRDLFKRHVAHYLAEVHKTDPQFQITSNWAFSSMMPEKVDLNLNYLSGDLTPGNAVYRAAFESRCLAPQGLHWDIMAWSFSWDPNGKYPRITKSATQLNQELSEVMAMGGGVQVYFKQNPDLSIQPWNIGIMKDIASFCRQRQPYCYLTDPVHDVALLYSGYAYEKNLTDVYPEWDPSLETVQGCLNVLMDNQLSVEVLHEYHLSGHLNEYGLVVIPDWNTLTGGFRSELLEFVKDGGRLILAGPDIVSYFAPELGIETKGTMDGMQDYTGLKNVLFQNTTSTVILDAPDDADIVMPFYSLNDNRYPRDYPSLVTMDYGKGKVALIPFDLGRSYQEYPHFAKRVFMEKVLDAVYPSSRVKIEGSNLVHAVLRENDGSQQLHLINVSGKHTDPHTMGFNEIPTVNNIHVEAETGYKPSSVVIQPGGKNIPFSYEKGKVVFSIEKLDIYDIIELNK